MVIKVETNYLLRAFAFDLAGFLAFDLEADFFAFDFAANFLGLAFAEVFFFGLAAVFFLAAVFRFGAAFRVAFFAAEACFFRVGAAGSFIMGAGVVLGSAIPIIGAGVEEEEDGAGGMAGVVPAAAPMAGALIAVSQPGVNISSRSRETGFARPQRGQWAS